jgi:hypothetical protein
MKFRPVGADMFHGDGRTDMNLTVAFRNCANTPKIRRVGKGCTLSRPLVAAPLTRFNTIEAPSPTKISRLVQEASYRVPSTGPEPRVSAKWSSTNNMALSGGTAWRH